MCKWHQPTMRANLLVLLVTMIQLPASYYTSTNLLPGSTKFYQPPAVPWHAAQEVKCLHNFITYTFLQHFVCSVFNLISNLTTSIFRSLTQYVPLKASLVSNLIHLQFLLSTILSSDHSINCKPKTHLSQIKTCLNSLLASIPKLF